MQVEVLSDHGGDQLRLSQQRLHAAEHNLATQHGGYQHAYQQYQAARRNKPLWRRILAVSTPEERDALARTQGAWQQLRHAEHGRTQIHQRVAQQSAGVSAEDTLTWALSGLSDEWVMLRGYRNRRGETDHVLVGPLGVWAVEVKRRRIRLHVQGDQWWYEKVDNWGNVVETGWAVDGGGRSWARQVNDIADALASWLSRNGHHAPVSTAVMLLHERAELGRCTNLTVNLLACQPQHLLDAVAASTHPLSPEECEDIVRLIRRDHHYHAKRKHRSSS